MPTDSSTPPPTVAAKFFTVIRYAATNEDKVRWSCGACGYAWQPEFAAHLRRQPRACCHCGALNTFEDAAKG